MNVGARKTRQREAIRDVFEGSERPLTIDELVDAAGGVGVATAYRAVAALLKEAWLETVEIPGEPMRYERAGKGHHHHFACEKCDRVFDVGGCIENVRKLAPPRFRVKAHAVTLLASAARALASDALQRCYPLAKTAPRAARGTSGCSRSAWC